MAILERVVIQDIVVLDCLDTRESLDTVVVAAIVDRTLGLPAIQVSLAIPGILGQALVAILDTVVVVILATQAIVA